MMLGLELRRGKQRHRTNVRKHWRLLRSGTLLKELSAIAHAGALRVHRAAGLMKLITFIAKQGTSTRPCSVASGIGRFDTPG
jgi:hypothetical protein